MSNRYIYIYLFIGYFQLTVIFHVMVTKSTMWDDTKYLPSPDDFSSYNRLARGFSGIFQPRLRTWVFDLKSLEIHN